MSKIRFGIVGTGRISDWVLQGAQYEPRFEASAVCSRTEENALAFAQSHGIKNTFTDVEVMAASDCVDAIYIGTPNSTHHDIAIKCMQLGKHVLCEKPLASNAMQVKEMIECAKQNNVLLMEAMISTLSPNFRKAASLVPSIHPIKHYVASFCQYSSKYEKLKNGEVASSFNPKLSGGALMDVGIYTIYPMVALFGKPELIQAQMDTFTLEDGSKIDLRGVIDCRYKNMSGTCIYSKINDSFLPTEISGEGGNIVLDQIHICHKVEYTPHSAPTSGRGKGPEHQDLTCSPQPDEYLCEFSEFISVLENGKTESAINSLYTSLSVIEIMDEARRQCGIIFPDDNL